MKDWPGRARHRASCEQREIASQRVPVQVVGLQWSVLIFATEGWMEIGCQHHAISRWIGFSDALISEMDSDALEFWLQWKEPLLAMARVGGWVEASAAAPGEGAP